MTRIHLHDFSGGGPIMMVYIFGTIGIPFDFPARYELAGL